MSKYSWISIKDWLHVWFTGLWRRHVIDDYENLWPENHE